MKKKLKKIEKITKEINTRSIYHLSLFITNKEKYTKKEDYVISEAIIKGFPIKNYNYTKMKVKE